jgi:hypothetical protein
MLDRRTMPVWFLADFFGLTAIGCCLTCVCLLPWTLRGLRNAQPGHQEESLRQLLALANQRLELLQADLEQRRAAEQREPLIRQRLLGLRGDLTRTVFVIDTSGSMKQPATKPVDQPNWGRSGPPWSFVCDQVEAWLCLLPVKSFRAVCFNNTTTTFPRGTAEWIAGETHRTEIMAFLRSIEPAGLTNTEAALREALALRPTCVILFTDGQPTSDQYQDSDPQQMLRILELCEHTSGIPINVVAVNNFLDPTFGGFLQSLAGRSGGGFIGL